jgi:hypothetical protein
MVEQEPVHGADAPLTDVNLGGFSGSIGDHLRSYCRPTRSPAEHLGIARSTAERGCEAVLATSASLGISAAEAEADGACESGTSLSGGGDAGGYAAAGDSGRGAHGAFTAGVAPDLRTEAAGGEDNARGDGGSGAEVLAGGAGGERGLSFDTNSLSALSAPGADHRGAPLCACRSSGDGNAGGASGDFARGCGGRAQGREAPEARLRTGGRPTVGHPAAGRTSAVIRVSRGRRSLGA